MFDSKQKLGGVVVISLLSGFSIDSIVAACFTSIAFSLLWCAFVELLECWR